MTYSILKREFLPTSIRIFHLISFLLTVPVYEFPSFDFDILRFVQAHPAEETATGSLARAVENEKRTKEGESRNPREDRVR